MLARGRGAKIRAPRRVSEVFPVSDVTMWMAHPEQAFCLPASSPPLPATMASRSCAIQLYPCFALSCESSPASVVLANMPSSKGLTKDEVDFDATWHILATAFQEIHSKNASQLSFEELFRNAYKLVLKKKADDLYDKVVSFEQTWLHDQVRVRIVNLVTPTILLEVSGEATDAQANERRIAGERFMKSLNDAFADQQLCMGMITDVLMYMVSSNLHPRFADTLLTVQGPCIQPRWQKTLDIHPSNGALPHRSSHDALQRRSRYLDVAGEHHSRHDQNGAKRRNR